MQQEGISEYGRLDVVALIMEDHGDYVIRGMSNARIQQIVTLLYMHKEIVSSSGVHTKEAKGLHEVMDRAYKNKDYYKNNPMLKSTFDFLKMVVDSWFAHE